MTENIDSDRLGRALDFAWSSWIGDVGHVPDAFTLSPKSATAHAEFEASAFVRLAAGRYDVLTGEDTAAPEGEAGDVPASALFDDPRREALAAVEAWLTDFDTSATATGAIAAIEAEGLTIKWDAPPAPGEGEGATEGATEGGELAYRDVEQATKALVRETWLWLADESVDEQVGTGRERLVRRFAERLGLRVAPAERDR